MGLCGRGPPFNPLARNMNWELYNDVALNFLSDLTVLAHSSLARPTSRAPAEVAKGLQANRELNTLGLDARFVSRLFLYKGVDVCPLAHLKPPHAHYTWAHFGNSTVQPPLPLPLPPPPPPLHGESQRPPPEQRRSSAGERSQPVSMSSFERERERATKGLANRVLLSMATRIYLSTWDKPSPRPTTRRSQHPT